MKKVTLVINLVFLFLFTSGYQASSQMSADVYRRADELLKKTTDKVYYGVSGPVWIGKTDKCLYENLTPDGRDYIILDAEKLTKRQAFDQVKFATAMGKVTGKKFEPGKLPIKNIVFSDKLGSFAFTWENYNWICNLRDYEILKRDTVANRGRQPGWDWGFMDELANGPVESPDKKWTAYTRNFNVYIKSAGDNKDFQLSTDGGVGEYYSSYIRWSPDSRKLVSCRVRPAEKHIIHYVESSPSDQLQPKHYSYEYQKPGDAIPQKFPQLFDVESKKHIKVDDTQLPNQYSVGDIKWSKDNSYFTFEYNKRGHQLYQVIKVDAATGEYKVIINETSDTFIDYSGKEYRYDAEGSGEIIWASERDGWNHLYLYDSGTGKVKNQITKGKWVVREVTYVDEKDRQIIFQASGLEPGDPYFIHFYRINFDGTGMKRLTDGEGTHEASFSPDHRYFIDTWSTIDTPPISVLRRAEDGSQLMVIEKADMSKFLETEIRLPEVFTAKGRDGETDIWGIIIRPTDFDPSKKYPVIEDIYAGPHGSFVPKSFRPAATSMHQLAELGFIVVKIDGMGTSNRSKSFHDVCWKNLKDAGFPDRILWIRAAVKKYPYMDIERVGVYGTSAGGQNAAGAVLFYPDFYKVAVASCGCHDNRMDKMWWNEQWMGWPVGEEYAESSNVENAWRLKGKLLLINGEMDNNVDPSSTVQLVNALIKAGKDFEYVFLPGVKHTSGGTYGERKRRDFFVKNLLGIDPPDWNMAEK
ncbi:MAG: DPP IV N-terminal domain-containing protein [Bacteroidota bacterium]|nr:DPP IV N-terminal domain-containing protein [Bacteroidota bacterium]